MIKEELAKIYNENIKIEDIATDLIKQQEQLHIKVFMFSVLIVINKIMTLLEEGVLKDVEEFSIFCESDYDSNYTELCYYSTFKFNRQVVKSETAAIISSKRLEIDLLLSNISSEKFLSEYFKNAYSEKIGFTIVLNELSKQEVEEELLNKLLPEELKNMYLMNKLDATMKEQSNHSVKVKL